MIDIGIIGAMEVEVNDLVSRLENRKCETVSGIDFHTGKLLGKEVAIAKCGIGKVFAAMAAEVMILKYAPKLLVNTGVGGALAHGLRCGDIVVAEKLCQHDMDTSPIGDPVGLVSGINRIWFETDESAREVLMKSGKELGLSVKLGSIATGDRFVATNDVKKYIVDTFGAKYSTLKSFLFNLFLIKLTLVIMFSINPSLGPLIIFSLSGSFILLKYNCLISTLKILFSL